MVDSVAIVFLEKCEDSHHERRNPITRRLAKLRAAIKHLAEYLSRLKQRERSSGSFQRWRWSNSERRSNPEWAAMVPPVCIWRGLFP